jgi:DNA helicase-2/ATP-dependent DNA helicase PcrA
VTLNQNRFRLATIHEVKGETHEAIMLVSASRRRDQSHWAVKTLKAAERLHFNS